MSSEVNFPGRINIGGDSHYSGCRAITFRTSDEFNAFFDDDKNFGTLVVKIFETDGGITVLYTKALSEEELADFNESNAEVQKVMEAKRRKRLETKAKLEELEEKREKEEKRLAALGRQCEKNHPKKVKGHE